MRSHRICSATQLDCDVEAPSLLDYAAGALAVADALQLTASMSLAITRAPRSARS